MIPTSKQSITRLSHSAVHGVLLCVALVAASCSGTSTDPPTSFEGPCTVSAILVPSCGAWLGASTPSADGSFDYAVGLAEYESVAGNEPDIIHFYKRDADVFPTPTELALAERPGRQRSLLFYNWKPSTTLTWRQVADGDADDTIDQVAQRLGGTDHHLFLAIYHEPENDQGPPGSGMTATDFVDMYRRVVTRMRAQQVDNVVYVMNYLGFGDWPADVDRFYPGDDVVDWIAYDPYGFANDDHFGEILDSPAGRWSGFYEWATQKFPGTPIMLGEWGIDLRAQPDAPSILESATGILAESFPMVKALVYWNDVTDGGFEVRLDQPTELGAAYGAAYAAMAAHPYFNSTSTELAP